MPVAVKAWAQEPNVDAKDSNGGTALMLAAHSGHLECLVLLIKARANVETKSLTDWTASMVAARNGHVDCLSLLINPGGRY